MVLVLVLVVLVVVGEVEGNWGGVGGGFFLKKNLNH